jgi:hypothetical protein
MKCTFSKISLGFAAAVVSVMMGSVANASLLLEPYLGYHTGKYTQGSTDQNLSGVSYGGRLGFQQLGFMGGIDYMTGSWKDDASPNSSTVTPSNLGVFVGYNFPILVRVYGEYGFSNSLKLSNNGGSDTLKGTGIKLGVGFTALPFLSINLEYITDTYTKDSNGTLTPEVTDKLYGVSVSLPLTFM